MTRTHCQGVHFCEYSIISTPAAKPSVQELRNSFLSKLHQMSRKPTIECILGLSDIAAKRTFGLPVASPSLSTGANCPMSQSQKAPVAGEFTIYKQID